MRPHPNQETPAGKPDMLFFLPEITGTKFFQNIDTYIHTYIHVRVSKLFLLYFHSNCVYALQLIIVSQHYYWGGGGV